MTTKPAPYTRRIEIATRDRLTGEWHTPFMSVFDEDRVFATVGALEDANAEIERLKTKLSATEDALKLHEETHEEARRALNNVQEHDVTEAPNWTWLVITRALVALRASNQPK